MATRNIGNIVRNTLNVGLLTTLTGCTMFNGPKEYSTFTYEPMHGGSIGVTLKIDPDAIPEIERGIVLYSATLGIPANGVNAQTFANDYGLYIDQNSDFVIEKDEVTTFFEEAKKYKEQRMRPLPRIQNSGASSYVGPR